MNFIGHGTVAEVKTSALGTCVREMLKRQGEGAGMYDSLDLRWP